MDLKQLRYFRAVAAQQSFTRAAEQLHVAQPAVSMAIRKLEQQLELTLFHRQDRGISLTDEGKRLLHHAERLLQAADDAELEMRELKGLRQGEVRVGIPSMLGSYYFPPILMAFHHRYPQLRLSVVEGGTWQLQQMLERGELDLGVIVAEFVPPELTAEVFLREQMLVTVGRQHPYATLAQVELEQFFSEELVMFKEGYFHRKVVDRLAAEAGTQPRIGFETNLIPLIKSIVRQGFGISTLLGMVIQPDDELVTIPFAEPVWLDLSIAWRREGYLSHANRAFVEFLREQRPPPAD
ncbi:LysR family transcriptional regulator [Marinobacterium arenosum]|uniref:LysR family transcriptional regulator n=1 Tax=Marinobacterium arenosum TaxID=2862496 RepID=UPI001C97E2C9|nr:LysR family transcriptional regulator [Marinobacterium arenosum]MBY4678054.1 LysR family transcriptional regulator [Marinobacterium arenosum]